MVVENAARTVLEGAIVVRFAIELVSRAVGRLRATSIVIGFADAIMWLLVASVAAVGF